MPADVVVFLILILIIIVTVVVTNFFCLVNRQLQCTVCKYGSECSERFCQYACFCGFDSY